MPEKVLSFPRDRETGARVALAEYRRLTGELDAAVRAGSWNIEQARGAVAAYDRFAAIFTDGPAS